MLGEIFQFVAANAPSLKKILAAPALARTSIIIDLEDALKNVIDDGQTTLLKIAGRNNLAAVLSDKNNFNKDAIIGLRVNSFTSVEFEKDLEFLSGPAAGILWNYIVVPKVETKRDLLFYKETLSKKVIYSELIPIIESVKGIQNVKEIFSDNFTLQAKRCFWGHHDYNLDALNWPFLEHEDKQYWQLTTALINSLKTAGIAYINGPIANFKNTFFVAGVLSELNRLCGSNEFGQAAITYEQVKAYEALRTVNYIEERFLFAPSIEDEKEKIFLAQRTVNLFEAEHKQEISFSFNEKKSDLYFAASLFMCQTFFK